MPRWRSSGALSIWSKATSRLAGSPGTAFARVLVMAAVSVVLPWSTWPMVPTFRCGLFLSNFPLDIWVFLSCSSSAGRGLAFLGDLLGDALRHLFVVIELHGEGGAPLGLGAHGGRVTEHLGERHHRPDDLAAAAGVHALDLPPARAGGRGGPPVCWGRPVGPHHQPPGGAPPPRWPGPPPGGSLPCFSPRGGL